MEPKYQPKNFEEKIYKSWEEKKLFEAKVDKRKKPFSIILPPPNANADLHLGHAMFVYEDIMIRFHKMLGEEVLWLPGADHAGFETQFVFETHLKKEGKSRFDFSSQTLYQMIWDFVINNRDHMENQLKRLGFALDWSKKKFTLDEDIVRIVKETFKKLYEEGLVYYQKAVVNYCVNCGTSFSDLEINHLEKESKLWYILYPFDLKNPKKGGIIVATTRPETMLGDEAVAVNPKDKRYQKLIGQEVYLPVINKKIPIITDLAVDPKFATGAVKVTPAHDQLDWEIGQRHKLLINQVIDEKGRMTGKIPKEFIGKKTLEARAMILEKLKKNNLLLKEKNHNHRLSCCYKCGRPVEPIPKKQWFIKVAPLAKKAKELVKKGEIKIYPSRFKKILIWWLDNFHDWNISRQIVWGIKIPAYYCQVCEKWFVAVDKPKFCPDCQGDDFVPTEDTFDTWFSSAQWPYAVLLTQKESSQSQTSNFKNDFFNYFYPTTVMETGYDILPWWVARMIMICYFLTKKPPFKNVVLHGMVRDKKGQKMSKSKGNVINPMEMIKKYGADALRLALVYETRLGADINLSEEKVVGMRNFVNKVWNIGRYLHLNSKKLPNINFLSSKQKIKVKDDLEKEFKEVKKKYLKLMKSYRFSQALGLIYQFLWHRLADFYLEESKKLKENDIIIFLEELKKIYWENLKMLHPFSPFVTEAIWKIFMGEKETLYQTVIK